MRKHFWHVVLVSVCGMVGTAMLSPAASADPEHVVRYVVTADGGQEVSIHYQIAPPAETWSGTETVNAWVSPEEPWEKTITLEDPDSAYVSVREIWWNPNMHCEVWVDGQRTITGTGMCIPRPNPEHWDITPA